MKKYLLLALFSTLIIPSVTFASWWNPLSWFQKSTYEAPVAPAPSDIPPAPAQIEQSPETLAPQVIHDTKIVEKPVIKTITVQDPALQIKINSLITENDSLKKQVEDLTTENKTLTDKLSTLTAQTNSVSEECLHAKEDVVAFNKKLADITATYYEERDRLIANFHGTTSGLPYVTQTLSSNFTIERNSINQSIATAQAEIQLYCK